MNMIGASALLSAMVGSGTHRQHAHFGLVDNLLLPAAGIGGVFAIYSIVRALRKSPPGDCLSRTAEPPNPLSLRQPPKETR
jgi:hypothetical protein